MRKIFQIICALAMLVQSSTYIYSQSAPGIQWQTNLGGDLNDIFSSISQTTDGGYICGGHSDSNISGDKSENTIGGYDYWIVKLDSSGNIQWQNT
ncbi:MAG: T9SS C-terminal target domain-containing protein, partial [Bacteroidota bacterium]